MVRHLRVPFSCLLSALCLLAPTCIAAHPQASWTETPLPVFELHSGFWINLHHTLYQEARQRRASTSREANAAKAAPPISKTVLAGKGPLTDAEQKGWYDAVTYYVANYADKDLLFTTELIQLKDQLGDF